MSYLAIATAVLTMLALIMLSGCGADYRPGVSGMRRSLPQNAPSNADFQPPGSLPR